MKRLELKITPEGEQLITDVRGLGVLRYPLLNKGTGFTPDERRRLDIEGLLPSRSNDIEVQAERIYKSIMHNADDVGRHIGLAALQGRNEHLFYKVLSLHLEELMPVIYTPTVGLASQHYSTHYRRARGLFITPDHRGRIEHILRSAIPIKDIRLMVVTDNESILGIGDQGAGGMAISNGKLALYCAGAGIHPYYTLPVSLDVGTDNEDLLEDPLYLGYRHHRLRGDEYLTLVDEFVEACKTVFPGALIQWEDFRKDNALKILDRYQDQVPSFNDDIQGTGAVATACITAGSRIANIHLSDVRILIYGAGAAGLGISRQVKNRLSNAGLRGEALARAVLVMDSRGVISDERKGLDVYKEEMAWPAAMVAAELGLDGEQLSDLAAVTRAYGANILVGASGQGGSFDVDTVEAMLETAERPIILPMSNPTSISEAVPSQLLDWTNGRALIATGSPFAPVRTPNGEIPIGQANNVFVFPGIGLGTIAAGATSISDTMIAEAATGMADSLTEAELAAGRLVPSVSRLWDVCGQVALAVARQAVVEGRAPAQSDDELEAAINAFRWKPRYPEIICSDD
ncbi:MAG: NAD-dependent malic enzyme [Woeseiaceae bacterium]|nr:NAD-dependent malic enzyme [Woeseiaceae bacterium]